MDLNRTTRELISNILDLNIEGIHVSDTGGLFYNNNCMISYSGDVNHRQWHRGFLRDDVFRFDGTNIGVRIYNESEAELFLRLVKIYFNIAGR